MSFVNRIKESFNSFLLFINRLPRKHFFALIILFVCLLIISFLPSQSIDTTKTTRQLVLPTKITAADSYDKAEPVVVEHGQYGDSSFDYTGKREVRWVVKAGDTLSNLFQTEGISAAALHELQEVDTSHLRLANLIPGQEISVLLDSNNQLLALKIKVDVANTLSFVLKDGSYIALLKTEPGEWRNSFYQGTITGSFYVNAKSAGLSDGQIRQISSALQEKFDFNRQLRVGDTFKVLVSKQYVNGQYTYDSEVLAVLIKTRQQTYSAFLNEDGRYFDTQGQGLGKAYRRLPVDGRPRISSPFNPKRFHPVTHRISPHNGTDFAVPSGTKVYAIGDGVVQFSGYHPAAGNYIVIKHGRKYTTRYLHLSKSLVRRGQRVKMGEIIARSGNTGRTTGPHLHYEFHIYGKPVNPMKVNLPLSEEISQKNKKAFNARRDKFLKEMNEL